MPARQLRLLQKASEMRVPVLLFLGKDGGKKIGWIKPVLEKVPDLVVVIDHMVGCPEACSKDVSVCLCVSVWLMPCRREQDLCVGVCGCTVLVGVGVCWWVYSRYRRSEHECLLVYLYVMGKGGACRQAGNAAVREHVAPHLSP